MEQNKSVELIEQLKEVFEVDLLEGTYHLVNSNLVIESKILRNYFGPGENAFYINLENGLLILSKHTKITKLEKIPYLKNKFDWVFEIHNISNEHIGYIGKPSE